MTTDNTENDELKKSDEILVKTRGTARWLPWIFGLALLAVVIMAARHFSDAQDFAVLVERAQPWWLTLAFILQVCTYIAYGQIYRSLAKAAQFPLRLSMACKLGIAKLFIDQAVPSAGLSGLVVLANAFERLGMSRATAAGAIVVNIASFYATFVLCLAIAIGITLARGERHSVLWLIAFAFLLVAVSLVIVILALPGRSAQSVPRGLLRFTPVRMAINFIQDADLRLTRSPRLLFMAVVYQLVIVVCDASTIWVLIRSLGGYVAADRVFASFMFSSLLRTVGFMPGGLGTFEAASVVTLRMVGVPTAMALAVTLLFRGLSFWLPMLPGLWFARHIMYPPRSKPKQTIVSNEPSDDIYRGSMK